MSTMLPIHKFGTVHHFTRRWGMRSENGYIERTSAVLAALDFIAFEGGHVIRREPDCITIRDGYGHIHFFYGADDDC